MTPEQVSEAVGLPIKQIDDMVGDGLFPQPWRITSRTRRWASELVEEYLAAKAVAPQAWENPATDFNMKTWPPKGLKVLRFDSHRKCGIYFLMRDGKVTYVGSSKNIYGRVGNHSLTKRFDYVRWVRVKEKKLYGVERDWILSLKSPLNGYMAKTGERIYCAPRPDDRRFREAGGLPKGYTDMVEPIPREPADRIKDIVAKARARGSIRPPRFADSIMGRKAKARFLAQMAAIDAVEAGEVAP